MSPSLLKRALKSNVQEGEILSQLNPRRYPQKWWPYHSSSDWPLPDGAAVIESRKGYQHGPENITLPWALRGLKAKRLVDLGTGSGSLLIIGQYVLKADRSVGVERQSTVYERTQRTLHAYEGFIGDRYLDIIEGDCRHAAIIGQVRTTLGGSADGVLINPPFIPIGWGRKSLNQETYASTHCLAGNIVDFLIAARSLLSESGWILILFDALRMHTLVPAIEQANLKIVKIDYTPDCRDHVDQPYRMWITLSKSKGISCTSLKTEPW